MLYDDEFPMMLEREVGLPDTAGQIAVAFGPYYEIDRAKSDTAGHEVYRGVIFVKIAVPGDRNALFFQPATDRHKQRFPKAWQAYLERDKGSKSVDGLPVEQWAPIGRSIALTLKAAHIHTVEALAEVGDSFIDKISGGRVLRDKARAFLAQAKDSAITLQLASEKKALENELSAMKAQIQALTASVAEKEKRPIEPDEAIAARGKRGTARRNEEHVAA